MYSKRLLCVTAALSILSFGASFGAARADEHPVKDSYITTKVKAELVSDFGKRASHIHVTTKDGVVALTGRVDSSDAKDRAEQDARKIDGVHEVINKLHVTGG